MDVCHHDNVTECLLRAMLVKMDQTAATFDWNPLNFAFTAAIGVLALVIAGITIFQGLLAAGPGRVKSSRAVIGHWSEFTNRRFDWDEYAIRSTAMVPYIGWNGLSALFIDESEKEVPQVLLVSKEMLPYQDRDFDSKASWLMLLSTLGLEYPKALGLDHLVSRSTDYLPADIQAAPAAAEVRCLVLMAAIADDGVVVDSKARFPSAIGNSSQLTFREHPVLGVVAAYERFTAGYRYKSAGKVNHWQGVKFTLEDVQDNTMERAKAKIAMFRSLICLASGQLSYNGVVLWRSDRTFFPWRNDLFTDLRSRNRNCGHESCERIYQTIRAPIIMTHLISTGIALLCATAPCDYRAFPTFIVAVNASMTRLLELQKESPKISKNLHVERLMRHAASALSVRQDTYAKDILSSWIKPTASTIQDINLFFKMRDAVYMTEESEGDRHSLSLSASVHLDDWERNSFDQYGRKILLRRLYNIDAWLSEEGGAEIACAMLDLLGDLFESEGAYTPWNEMGNLIPDPVVAHSTEGLKPRIDIFADDAVIAGLRWFLIYRALLYAQMLITCNDTSPLFAKDFKDSVVKVL